MPEFDFISILQYLEYYEQGVLQMDRNTKDEYDILF